MKELNEDELRKALTRLAAMPGSGWISVDEAVKAIMNLQHADPREVTKDTPAWTLIEVNDSCTVVDGKMMTDWKLRQFHHINSKGVYFSTGDIPWKQARLYACFENFPHDGGECPWSEDELPVNVLYRNGRNTWQHNYSTDGWEWPCGTDEWDIIASYPVAWRKE